MKKRLVLFCLVLIMSMYLVSAAHVITTSTGESSYSLDEDIIFIYNITVNNTDEGQDSNITRVDITIPSSFKFTANTNGTNAPYETFTNTSTTLSWTNSAEYLINGSELKYFWLSANASTPGDYNLVVATYNATGSYSSNIAVAINEVAINQTSCTPNWDCTSWSICINETQTRNCTDLNNCGNETNKPLTNQSCGCTPNWQCTEWSECISGIQIKSCVDFNTCGDNSTKPAENQSCLVCTPNWQCTPSDWSKCIDGIQTKNCTDLNNCGIITGKPAETKSCTNKLNFNWSFSIIVILIISMIAIDILLIIRQWKKLSSINTKINIQQRKSFTQTPAKKPSRFYPPK